jgi:hypothetical protein
LSFQPPHFLFAIIHQVDEHSIYKLNKGILFNKRVYNLKIVFWFGGSVSIAQRGLKKIAIRNFGKIQGCPPADVTGSVGGEGQPCKTTMIA